MASESEDESPAIISIIVDDIGYRLAEGRAIIELPAALTYAVLPNAPHTKQLARLAHQRGKEVMLHMPMQATSSEVPEQGALTIDMTEREVASALEQAFSSVPYAIGMNNHQGSLLTQHPGHMKWVMLEMKKNKQFFVDSRTTTQSIAKKIALENGVPSRIRDVFLDHDINKASIEGQFYRLIKLAQKRGYAIGIGHPHPETLAVLEELLPKLDDLNVKIVPISSQFQRKERLHSSIKK